MQNLMLHQVLNERSQSTAFFFGHPLPDFQRLALAASFFFA
jgi:hypothetical protein